MSLKGFLKFAVVGFLGLVLSIGLIVVRETVSERSEYREKVYSEMAKTTAASQILLGPILVFPYERVSRSNSEVQQRFHFVYPKQLAIAGNLKSEKRYRGLYEVLLYDADLTVDGTFNYRKPEIDEDVRWLKPYIVVLVQDSRGISTLPVLTWNEGGLEVKPGPGDLKIGLNGGFHADLPVEIQKGGAYNFHVAFRLRGMQSFGWLPVGENTKVSLKSDWPHPSFQGRSLPVSHAIAENGFEAVWESNHFGSNETPLLETAASPINFQDQDTNVRFFQPVDIYVQTERAVKYGFLFVALTFAAFLAFEAIQKLSIHPVQYGFVGTAIVVFYILLLALSEHISFIWAYVSASLASASLLAFYARYVLQSWARSLIFAAALIVLDSIVYGILQSEDFALLYGSLLLFSVLAVAMIITRRVNWNELKSEL